MKQALIILIGFIIPIVIILQMFLIFHNIETSPKEEEKPIFTDSSTSGYYSTIVIDSCEYIEAFNRLAHKGNCRFCAERHRREIGEYVQQLNKED